MLANLPVPTGHDANTPVRGEGPGGADAAAHPRLSSRANRGVASQQAAALARPPEQGDASGEEERHVRADRASPLDELQARRAARPTPVSLLHRREGSSAAR